MCPQNPDPSTKKQDADIALLQKDLKQLGFDIPEDEIEKESLGPRTEEALKKFQEMHSLDPTGTADEDTLSAISRAMADLQPTKSKPFVVRGQVSHSDGSPLSGGLVRAYDKDLRSETPLGEAKLDEEGRYEISYGAERGEERWNSTGMDHHDRDSMSRSNRVQMV